MFNLEYNEYKAAHNGEAKFREFPKVLFTTKSGGSLSKETVKTFPGGGGPARIVSGPHSVGDVTLEKQWEPIKDFALVQFIKRSIKNEIDIPLNLIHKDLEASGIQSPNPALLYSGCVPSSIDFPEVQKGSSEVKMLRIVVQPVDVD